MTTMNYQSIDTAINIFKHVGRWALLAKTDLQTAYKQIPIHPSDVELLGFMVSGSYLIIKQFCIWFELFLSPFRKV